MDHETGSRQVRPQCEVGVDGPYVALLAELAEALRKVIRHEAKVIGEESLLQLRRLPAGQVIADLVAAWTRRSNTLPSDRVPGYGPHRRVRSPTG